MGMQIHYFLVDRADCESLCMSDFDFGDFIRQRRRELGWGQEEAAQKTGLTVYTYGRIERGEVQPKLEQVTKIFLAFGLSLGELTESTDREVLTARMCLDRIDFYAQELRKLLGQ